MDLHGNVSWHLIVNTDLITYYHKAPHEDAINTKKAVENLLKVEKAKSNELFMAITCRN